MGDEVSSHSLVSDMSGPSSPYLHCLDGRSTRDRPSNHRECQWFRHTLPKLSFPKFEGSHPKIWLDKCMDYFRVYEVQKVMWVTIATLHMEGKAAKWWQVYKLQASECYWRQFRRVVEMKFGVEDYCKALATLLDLKQTTFWMTMCRTLTTSATKSRCIILVMMSSFLCLNLSKE